MRIAGHNFRAVEVFEALFPKSAEILLVSIEVTYVNLVEIVLELADELGLDVVGADPPHLLLHQPRFLSLTPKIILKILINCDISFLRILLYLGLFL